MDRTPALVALAVGLALVASALAFVPAGGDGVVVIRSVVAGSLALFGLLLALSGWFGRRDHGHRSLLVGLAVVGLVLLFGPVAGLGGGLLTWAIVAALAALLGGLPATVLLFRASRDSPG